MQPVARKAKWLAGGGVAGAAWRKMQKKDRPFSFLMKPFNELRFCML
jgi:hypothetical protein